MVELPARRSVLARCGRDILPSVFLGVRVPRARLRAQPEQIGDGQQTFRVALPADGGWNPVEG